MNKCVLSTSRVPPVASPGNPLTARIKTARELLRNLSSDLLSHKLPRGAQYDEASWVFATKTQNRER